MLAKLRARLAAADLRPEPLPIDLRDAFCRIATCLPLCLLGGCGLRGAPSYNLFGAFFPGWLLCAAIGVAGSIGLRHLLLATSLEAAMPLKAIVYTAFAAGLAVSIWLLLFWSD